VSMETLDNQLDFSALTYKNLGKETFEFKFVQKREIVLRDCRLDEIAKFVYIINKEREFFALALRQSGGVDLYWNMSLVDTPEDCKRFAIFILHILVLASNVACSFDALFI
jgi:hypothetical protein